MYAVIGDFEGYEQMMSFHVESKHAMENPKNERIFFKLPYKSFRVEGYEHYLHQLQSITPVIIVSCYFDVSNSHQKRHKHTGYEK